MKNFLELLETIERKRPVGTLILGRRGQSFDLFIEEDRIYYAGREFSGRVDIDGLIQSGLLNSRISTAVLQTAISGANLVQTPLPEVLFERGCINAQECSALMLSQIREETFAHLFRHGDSFAFQESQVPEHLLGQDPQKAWLPVQALSQLLRNRSEAMAAVEALVPSFKEILVVTEKGMAYRSSTEADYAVRRILDLIDGFRGLNEIIRDVIFFEFQVLSRVADALVAGHLKKTVLPESRDVLIEKLDREEAARYLPAFKNAVKHAVDEIGARGRLALLHEHLGNNEEAVIQYNFMGDALYRMKKMPRALKAFQRALDLHPGDPLITDKVVKILQEAAEEAVREGKRDTALGLLKSAVKIRPDIHPPFERLLGLYLEAEEVEKAAELCDLAVERCHAEQDMTLAHNLLTATAEKFPENSLFSKKLVNLYLDFGMPEEAVAELEELARREMEHGKTAQANEILEKILRIDPDRDDIRRHLKGTVRRTRKSPRRIRHRRIWVLRLVLVLIIALLGYQYWSYTALEPFLEAVRAHAAGPAPAETGIERSAHEEKILGLAAGAEQFQERFPLSLFVSEAHRLASLYQDEAARLARERDRRKEKIYREAFSLGERGRQEEAVRAFRRLLSLPANDPWRVRAAEAMQNIEGYQRAAEELRQRAATAVAAEDWTAAYQTLRRLLDDYPLSRAAAQVEVPVRVRTIPDGATLKVGPKTLGPAPQLVRVRPEKPAEVEAEKDGFFPLKEAIPDKGGLERFLILNRQPLWTASLGEAPMFPPVLGRDLVLLVLKRGTLTARSRTNGAARWTYGGGTVVGPVAPPVEVEGRIFLPLNDGHIIRFSAAGVLERRLKSPGLISTPLVLWGASPVHGTSSGNLAGWDLKGDAPSWTLPIRADPLRLALSGQNRVLVAAEKGRLLSIELPGGRLTWDTPLGKEKEIIEGPFALGESVVIVTADRRLLVLAAKTGKVTSRRPLPPTSRWAALPRSQRVLIAEEGADHGWTLLEIDPASSKEAGRGTFPFGVANLFELWDGAGATLSSGGFLDLAPGTYQPRWGYRPQKGHVIACAADQTLLVIATDAGELVAFGGTPP